MTISTDSLLRAGIAGHGDEPTLTLDPAIPGTPRHRPRGLVLAAFHAVAGLAVPGGHRCLPQARPARHAATLFSFRRARRADAAASSTTPTRCWSRARAKLPETPGPDMRRSGPARRRAATCLVDLLRVWVDNALGLHVRLSHDDRACGALAAARASPRRRRAAGPRRADHVARRGRLLAGRAGHRRVGHDDRAGGDVGRPGARSAPPSPWPPSRGPRTGPGRRSALLGHRGRRLGRARATRSRRRGSRSWPCAAPRGGWPPGCYGPIPRKSSVVSFPAMPEEE